MSLKKDDIVELVEKDNNGWWLVKKGSQEGWAPNNYLELVPPKPKTAPAPPPPPPPPPPGPGAGGRRPPSMSSAPGAPPAPRAPAAPTVKVTAKAIVADASAKPISVFPGMGPSNGSAAPWKRTASAATHDSQDSTPSNSRPSSSLAAKHAPPPPVASKPKPAPPPIGHKPGAPGAPRIPGKPPVPTASRPPAAAPAHKSGGVGKPAAVGGQLDLAAAVSYSSFSRIKIFAKIFSQLARRAQKIAEDD